MVRDAADLQHRIARTYQHLTNSLATIKMAETMLEDATHLITRLQEHAARDTRSASQPALDTATNRAAQSFLR